MQVGLALRQAGCAKASRRAYAQHILRHASSEHEPPTPKRKGPASASSSGDPSVADRLFPVRRSASDRQQAARRRDIPRIPLRSNLVKRKPSPTIESHHASADDEAQTKYPALDAVRGPAPVLKLEAVSKNLTITDFRRIIPQGKHIEGWTLQNGDILRVIPGRQLDTLTPRTFYFLVFASASSAQAYLEHAKSIHELAKQYTPESLHAGSQVLPPGITAMGMDVASVVQAYTLLSPDSRMFLRQLNFPLSAWTKLFVQHAGLPWVKNRPHRSPYELRLTLDGPEVSVARLSKAFRASGEDRALHWSGGSTYDPLVSKWDPDTTRSTEQDVDDDDDEIKHPAEPIYILGFETVHAARSFRAHWHRRRLDQSETSWDNDDPPVLNLDFLW